MTIEPGTRLSLVFKAQAFAPVPNQQTKTMDMVLNVITGTYRGEENDSFLVETESHSGVGVLWTVKKADILMYGIPKNTARLAIV